MKDSLVAINIIFDGKIINPSLVPILYYWNGEDVLEDNICSDEKIKEIIKQHITCFEQLNSGCISYFYYVGENEVYTENTIYFNKFINLDDLNDMVWINIVKPKFLYLYKCAFNEEYKNDLEWTDTECLQTIYNQIYEKYKDKVTKTTFINYIRTKLTDLDEYNVSVIIDKLDNIL